MYCKQLVQNVVDQFIHNQCTREKNTNLIIGPETSSISIGSRVAAASLFVDVGPKIIVSVTRRKRERPPIEGNTNYQLICWTTLLLP